MTRLLSYWMFIAIIPWLGFHCSPRFKRYLRGKESTPLKWSSQVLIVSKSNYWDICGGSLISEKWVLTAAHCVMDNPNENLDEFQLIFGEHNRRKIEGNEVWSDIEEVFPYPMYEMQNYSFDVALLRLKYPIDFSSDKHKHLKSACLDLNGVNITGLTCVGTGWGISDEFDSMPDTLQELDMTVFDHKNCSKIHYNKFKDQESKEQVSDTHICMITEKNSISNAVSEGGSCGGDSGGPLQCLVDNQWMQIGIAWSGTDCLYQPSVYNLVNKYAHWIIDVTNYELPLHCI